MSAPVLSTARANLERLLERKEAALDQGYPPPHPKVIEAAEAAVRAAEAKAEEGAA